MKRPFFNKEQRVSIYCDTMMGANLMLNLAVKKLLRDVYKADGWIAMKKAERVVVRLANLRLLGRDNKRKWYQFSKITISIKVIIKLIKDYIKWKKDMKAKPILLVTLDRLVSRKLSEWYIHEIKLKVKNQYHVLLIFNDNATKIDISVLNVQEAKKVNIEELREIVLKNLKDE